MLTFRQILEKCLPNRLRKAEFVKIIEAKQRKNPEGYPMVIAKVKSVQKADGKDKKPSETNTYVASIEVLPKGYVVLSCSCDDFLYMWEVALRKNGAARVEYSNGKLPQDKNPEMRPGCCGHLVALGKFLIQKGKL